MTATEATEARLTEALVRVRARAQAAFGALAELEAEALRLGALPNSEASGNLSPNLSGKLP